MMRGRGRSRRTICECRESTVSDVLFDRWTMRNGDGEGGEEYVELMDDRW